MGVNFLTTHVINFVRNKTLTFRELYLYVSPYGHSDLDISMYSIVVAIQIIVEQIDYRLDRITHTGVCEA